MPIIRPGTSKRVLSRRLKVAALTLLGFLIPSACVTPPAMCYEAPAITKTPTPFVQCYTVVPTPTPTSTQPASPLSTPTPTLTPKSRGNLREKLLAGGRFPAAVARQLED